jgi:transposase-like protein
MIDQFKTLPDLMIAFRKPEAAVEYFAAIRWKDGKFCPYCASREKIYTIQKAGKKAYKCSKCRSNFSVTVGTIFGDTKLPLRIWFGAIWLLANHPKGIASTTLAKDLGISQPSAWFVLHRLRYAARNKSFNKPLSGVVEVDDGFFGSGGKSAYGKTQVIAAAERKGRVVARVAPLGLGKPEAQQFVDDIVSPDAELVTDSGRAYRSLDVAKHAMVNHSKGEGRSGEANTQTIEAVWSQLKRQINGTHHWVSPKHLQKYLDEMAWRMSRRGMSGGERIKQFCSEVEGRLTYKGLIA